MAAKPPKRSESVNDHAEVRECARRTREWSQELVHRSRLLREEIAFAKVVREAGRDAALCAEGGSDADANEAGVPSFD